MADAHTQKHPFHLVEPSKWPIFGAVGAFVLTFGLVMYMHDMPGGGYILPLGGLLVLYTMFMWWRDVVMEAQGGFHTKVVQLGLRFGMALFIVSEVMFFLAWFWAFFNASVFPQPATGGIWPPEGIEVFDPWHLPLINTLILLLSGTTVTWAHHGLLHDDRDALKWGLICTIALGVLFTSVQAYEYNHAAFEFGGDAGSAIYGSTFFMATGFHGAHVIIGTIFLTVCLIRVYKGHFTPDHHFGFEAAAWYWHFVDVVWLFLFSWVYVWASVGASYH